MTLSYNFQIGTRSVDLDKQSIDQLLNATSAREAYSQKGGLWASVCNFFCLGTHRNAIRALFNAIATADKAEDPAVQLARFEKLSTYTSPSQTAMFLVDVQKHRDKWHYSLEINNVIIYTSEQMDIYATAMADRYKEFCAKMTVFNIQQQAKDLMTGTPEKYASEEIQTLSDIPGTDTDKNNLQSAGGGTSRVYLAHHMTDKFFCSDNFKEVKIVSNDFFDVVFRNKDGEERTLRLCNREPTNEEFRGSIAQKAFSEEKYTSFEDLLSRNFGTAKDTCLKYLTNAVRQNLINLISREDFKASDVRFIFENNQLSITEGKSVKLSDLMYKD